MGKEMSMATVQMFPAGSQSATHTAALMSKVSKNCGVVQALKNFDLEVRAGQLTAVLGPNGAGKTTAIRLLLGLARPTSGKVSVFGGDPTVLSTYLRVG